jgi:hypothetical protein
VQCNNSPSIRSIILCKVVERIDDKSDSLNAGQDTKTGAISMNENVTTRDGSSLARRLAAAPMPESDRRRALAALQLAEAMVDAGAWLVRKLGEVGDRLFLRPGVKH